GKWIWRLDDTRRVLYRLPKLIDDVKAGRRIFIVEGEKDVRRLHKRSLAATTCPAGATKWRHEYSEFLRDADVVLLPDNDEPGRKHVADVAAKLNGIAHSIRIVDLAAGYWPEGDTPEEHDDVSDWLDAGGTAERLEDVADAAPEWQPSSETEAPTMSGRRMVPA